MILLARVPSLAVPIVWSIAICVILSFMGLQCGSTCDITRDPDATHFKRIVGSRSLQDSLAAGKIMPGMPYFVVSEIFAQCESATKKQVACIGCRQRVDDTEGWDRHYVPLKLRIYCDEYKTKSGTLAVWYQYPDFYQMEVAAGDTLWLYSKAPPGQEVFASRVNCLVSPDMIRIKNKVPDYLRGDTLYGEIHYSDNPDRPSGITCWYLLKLVNDTTLALRTPSFLYYPIEQLEFNNEPVSSFQWRKTQ